MPNQRQSVVTVEQWSKATPDVRGSVGLAVPSAQVELASLADIVKLLQDAEAEEIEALEKAGVDPSAPERVIPYTFSTEQRDRDRDRILVKGWELGDYRKNPVILPSHQSQEPVIGRSLRTWKDMGGNGSQRRLRGLAQYAPKDVNPLAFMIYELARQGYQKAGSVGFLPLEYERDPELPEGERSMWGGFLFKRTVLLEFSSTAVPSNPGALAEAKSAGIDLAPFTPWAERILDGEGAPPPGIDRKTLEAAAMTVNPAKPTIVVSEPETKTAPEPDAEPATVEPETEPEQPVRRSSPVADLLLAGAEALAAAERFNLAVEALDEHVKAMGGDVARKLKGAHALLGAFLGEPEEQQSAPQKQVAPSRDPYEGVEPDPEPEAEPVKRYSLAELAAALAGNTQVSGQA